MATITEDTLISEFVAESRDHLESLEPDLLLMEQEGADVSSDVVNRAFRAIHSIKGSSSVLGFDVLMKLSHMMENVLMQFRNQKMVPNADNIDALLQSADKVSFMIDDVHASSEVDCSEEMARLNTILENSSDHQPSSQKLSQSSPAKSVSSSQEFEAQVAELERSKSETPTSVSDETDADITDSAEIDTSQQTETQSLEPEILPETADLDVEQKLLEAQSSAPSDIVSPTPISFGQSNEISFTKKGKIRFDLKGPDHFVCEIDSEKLLNTYNNEKFLYAIWISGASDLIEKDRTPEEFLNDMISFGTYIYSNFAQEKTNDQSSFHMLISTILEKDLLEKAIDIPKDKVYIFPSETYSAIIQQIQDTSDQATNTLSCQTEKQEKSSGLALADTKPSENKLKVSESATTSQSSPTDCKLLKNGSLRLEAFGPDLAIFEVENKKIATIVETNKKLFMIWINPQKDLLDNEVEISVILNDIQSLGECISHDCDREISDPMTQYYHMLVSSIMDKDLLCNGLDLNNNQIVAFRFNDLSACIQKPDKSSEPTESRESTSKSVTQTEKPTRKESTPKASTTANQEKQSNKVHITENIRVSVDLIDRLMNLAGELVLGRNQLRQEVEEKVVDNPRLTNVMQNVNLVTSEIQENIMRMRMQPLSSIFNKFPRVVRDIARQLYKKAEIFIDGDEVELDKSILENLSDPLTHIIRNSLDHGIEPPEVRVKNNKPEIGEINLAASHEGSQVIITISDNGRGINADELTAKAIKNNVITQEQAARMSVKQKTSLIFLPGFSTAKAVSDISGRGVGMDVVKTNIERLGGHVDLDTTVGQGTTVIIRLPLTLSIIPSLIVGSSTYIFAIPQINVQELVSIKESEIDKRMEKVGDATVLRLRERLLPMVWLNDVLNLKPDTTKELPEPISAHVPTDVTTAPDNRFLAPKHLNSVEKNINIVVLRVGTNNFGLAVNQLFDNEEIVVKPLSRHIKDCKCFSGSTIMGDGRVAMILDTAGIADFAFLRFSEINAEERRRREQEEREKKAASRRKPVLLFNNALDEYFGLPLSNISRLELISKESIHLVGQREFVNYNGKGLPVIRLESFLAVNPLPELDELYLIIPKSDGPMAGIMASRIINILDIQEDVSRDAYTPRGFLGSGFIEGYLTFFLDPDAILQFLEEAVS